MSGTNTYKSNSHSRYLLQYHLIFVCKYRKYLMCSPNIVSDENGKQSDIFDFIPDTRNIDIDEELDKKEIFKIIDDYINNCEQDYKDLFYDYYFNGIKQKELAKRYNLSQGQVSRKIKSIIKCLQELLKDYK